MGVLAHKLTESTALWRHAPDETKEHKNAELLQGDRCRLVVVGTETGGRLSTEAVQFVGDAGSSLGTGRVF